MLNSNSIATLMHADQHQQRTHQAKDYATPNTELHRRTDGNSSQPHTVLLAVNPEREITEEVLLQETAYLPLRYNEGVIPGHIHPTPLQIPSLSLRSNKNKQSH